MVADEINYLYRPSAYKSYRYANYNDHSIPPYHISLCRAFVNFDGHKIKNGIKIGGSSNRRLNRHTFNAEKIMLPKGYEAEMNGLPLNDYRNFCTYALENKLWITDNFQASHVEQFWMETQGNLYETVRCMMFHYRDSYLR